MDIVFLGYCVSKDIAENLSGVSIAANKMQLNLLTSINSYIQNLYITTIYPVASFPVDKQLIYGEKSIEITDCLRSERVPFLNLPLFKQINQICANYRIVKRLVKKNRNTILLTFNMYPQIGLPAAWIKKKYGNRIVTLLADLPIDDNYVRSGISKWIYQFFNTITIRLLKQVDDAIALNRKAWEIYTPQARCLIMEGGYDEKEYYIEKKEAKTRKNIVYGGSLNEYSGVRELVESMEYVEDMDIELDIYGDGYLREFVRSRCNNRVHYYGTIPNDEMVRVQQKAWALINPRTVEDPIAKVTFPSKIFEFMASGTPVISTRLNGFLPEYDGLLIYVESNEPQKMAKCIMEMASRPYTEMLEMAKRARKFIIENKNWNIQAKKIVNFIAEETGEKDDGKDDC